jgi:hypothetical protein
MDMFQIIGPYFASQEYLINGRKVRSPRGWVGEPLGENERENDNEREWQGECPLIAPGLASENKI